MMLPYALKKLSPNTFSPSNDIGNVLFENGVFTIAAMTSAATCPTFFKSITILKDHVTFCTSNGTEGSINLHTNEEENIIKLESISSLIN
ncbi:unnamed protein product [Rhizophagus irregularis]|nr:unnamed protein product [Rhizophagus irregularis]